MEATFEPHTLSFRYGGVTQRLVKEWLLDRCRGEDKEGIEVHVENIDIYNDDEVIF